jgi:hypothetical protein
VKNQHFSLDCDNNSHYDFVRGLDKRREYRMNYFKNLLVATSLLLGTAVLAPQAAQATVVNFDNLSGFGTVADGYGGITWDNNWTYYDSPQSPYNPSSGATRIFSNYAKFPAGSLSDIAFSFSAPVTFQGAFFSGFSGNGDLTVSVFLAGVLKATTSLFSPSSVATFLASGYSGAVDKVVVHGNAGFYVMDDVTYSAVSSVPVPAAIWLMLSGLAGLAGIRRARA